MTPLLSSRPVLGCPLRFLRAVAAAAALALAGAAEASVEQDLKGALRSNHAGLERCYDRELKRAKPARGTLVISMTIQRDGRLGEIKLAKVSKRQKSVGRCLVRKLKRLRLPAQDSAVAVRLPIRLKARGS